MHLSPKPPRMSSQSIATDFKAKIESLSLISCYITLSIVHHKTAAEELVKYPVTVLNISATGMTLVIRFNAIVQKSTNSYVMLESFYNEFLAIKATEGPYYQKCSLTHKKSLTGCYRMPCKSCKKISIGKISLLPTSKWLGQLVCPFHLMNTCSR